MAMPMVLFLIHYRSKVALTIAVVHHVICNNREIEILRRVFLGWDPLVPDFEDLSHGHRAVADGGPSDTERIQTMPRGGINRRI